MGIFVFFFIDAVASLPLQWDNKLICVFLFRPQRGKGSLDKNRRHCRSLSLFLRLVNGYLLSAMTIVIFSKVILFVPFRRSLSASPAP